jgi:hypothetical protein
MERRILFTAALILATVAQATSAPQTTVVTEQPAHDAYVRSSTPTTNYGGITALRVRKSSSDELNAYLKFDVSGLSGFIQSATLRLYVTDASPDGGSLYLVSNNYQGTATPWLQSGLNWNNAPPISGTALSSAGAVSLNQWVEFDVTSAIAGDGTYSFALKNNSSNAAYYSAKEGSNKPELVIQIESGPPPPPSLTLTTPNGGEIWTIGSNRTILWTSMGSIDNVALEFSSDAGANWSPITTSTLNDGSFGWMIPGTESNQCLVRVSDGTDGDPSDVSNAEFAIVAPPANQYALRFDGVDDVVEIADNALLSGGPGKSLTLEVWVKLESVSGHHPIVTKYLDGTWKDWGIEVDAGKIVVDIENNGDNWAYIIGSVSPGVWTHLAFTFDNAANTLRIYMNGVEVGSGATLTKEMPDTQAALTFGRHYGNFVMPGTIDEVRVWNYARSANQIAATMSTPLVGNETGLIGYWSFDEGSGQSVGDVTGNGSNGRLGNSTGSDGADPVWVISTVPLGSPTSTLTLTVPNGGESWNAGRDHTITWTSQGYIANVKLEYSVNNGADWTTIVTSTPNDGSHAWTIPGGVSSENLVRISDATDGDPVDVSDAVFSIAAALPAGQLLPDLKIWVNAVSPKSLWDAEINLASGETRLRFSNTTVNVGAGALELLGIVNSNGVQPAYQRIYHDDGGYEDILVGTFVFVGHEDHNHFHFKDFAIYRLRQVTSGDGVGPIVASSDKISFCITDSDEYDQTLPGAPSSHVYDCLRQGMSIGWGDRYGRSTEGQWIVIDDAPDGTYWLESEANPDRLLYETRYDNNSDRIKISINKSTRRVKVLSDLLRVTEPNGGEKWKAGSRQTVRWAAAGKVKNVKLEYSTTGGASWTTITTSTSNDSSHGWDVPNQVSSDCLIRISDAEDGKPFDESDVHFSIVAGSSVASMKDDGEFTDGNTMQPEAFRLGANYPNPFNPETRIDYDLPEAVFVRLKIYDLLGREVVEVISGEMPAGFHSVVWRGLNQIGAPVGSGIYFYRLQAGEFQAAKRMAVVR